MDIIFHLLLQADRVINVSHCLFRFTEGGSRKRHGVYDKKLTKSAKVIIQRGAQSAQQDRFYIQDLHDCGCLKDSDDRYVN